MRVYIYMCVRRKNEGGPRDRGPFPSCHRVARFLNSQFLGIFVPRRFWIRGGWKERKIFTTLSLFITSMRRIRYRFASNIPSFPLSLRHTVVSDNHGEGGEEEEGLSDSRNMNRRKISSMQFQPVSRRLFSRSDKELVSRYYSTPRSRRRWETGGRIPGRAINYYTRGVTNGLQTGQDTDITNATTISIVERSMSEINARRRSRFE